MIWATKKSLKLLEPNTDLHAVYVEGASCSDNKIFSDDESVLLSIDVSEYFGSDKFDTAAEVIFSQLKYSTRHGNQAWTLSMLSTSTNSLKKDLNLVNCF